MTLVARFGIRNYAFLLADSLISSSMPSGQGIRLPAMNQLIEVAPQSIVGLRQKINHIGPHILIGWAGNLGSARDAHKYLGEKLADCQPTYELLGQLLTAMPEKFPGIERCLSLTGYVNDPGGIRDFCWGANTWTLESQLIGKITLLGSGFRHAAGTFAQYVQYPRASEFSTEFEKSLYFALNIATDLLADELHDNSIPTEDEYGGIYETATWLQDKFTKIGGITYIFWKVRPEGGQVNLALTKLIKMDYLDDLLLVRALTPMSSNNGVVLANERFEIPPLLAPVVYQPRIAPTDYPPLDSAFTSHILTEDVIDRPARELSILDYAEKGQTKSFEVLENSGRMECLISEMFWDRIRTHFTAN